MFIFTEIVWNRVQDGTEPQSEGGGTVVGVFSPHPNTFYSNKASQETLDGAGLPYISYHRFQKQPSSSLRTRALFLSPSQNAHSEKPASRKKRNE